MALLKMISSPYRGLRNLRVCCHYTLHFGNSVHEVAGFNRNYCAFFNQGNAVFEVLIRKIKVQSSIIICSVLVERGFHSQLVYKDLFIFFLLTSAFHFHFRLCLIQDACYTGITRDARADSFIPTVCFAN